MATAMCFRHVVYNMRRPLFKWKKTALSSTLTLCRTLASENLLERKMCSLWPALNSEKRKESDDRDRRGTEIPYGFLGLTWILYAVFSGKCLAECAGEDAFCSTEVNVQEEVSKTPANNDKSRDTSGRFSSSRKILKSQQKQVRAINLLKNINSVKRKLELDDEQEKEEKEHWKRRTRSMTVSFPFYFLVIFRFVYIPVLTCNTRPVVTRGL